MCFECNLASLPLHLLGPQWGSKRREEQQAYEDRLYEAMNRARAEKGAKAES